jgi:lipopolysaccharide biosynthesis protein
LQRPYAASASTPAASDPIQPAKGGARVAVILHLFFTDLWEEFLRVLERLPFAFDLYVSVPYRARSALAQRVQSRFPDAIVFGVRNLGRDISPFLRVLSAVGADRYEYFLKLHGKKSLHLENTRVAALGNGAEWRTSAASSLTGGGNGAQALLDWLDRHPDVGLVAPDGMLFDAEAWSAGTRDVLAQLGTRLGVDLIPRGTFPAGTMFWARAEALQPLFRLPPEALEFEREAGQTDATLHHAYERAFALIARQGGYRVVDTTEAGT